MDDITPAPSNRFEVLQLADTLGSVSEACRRTGISRTQFYEYKKQKEAGQETGSSAGRRATYAVPSELNALVLACSETHPSWGALRISEFVSIGRLSASQQMVQRILNKNGLGTSAERLERLEALIVGGKITPTPEQIAAITKHNPAFKERGSKPRGLGQFLCQDTLSFGVIPGVGPILAQVIIDTYNSYAFGYLHEEKMAEHAAVVLHHDVIPQYRRWGIKVREIMTDRGKEFCGSDTHPYELYLSLHNIEHRVSTAPRLAGNGFIERFAKSAQEEFFAPAMKAKEPWALELLQEAFLYWILKYNHETPLAGFPTMGKAPALVCPETACRTTNYGRVPLDQALE